MKFLVIFIICVLGATAIDEEFLKQTRARIRKAIEECVVEEKAAESDLDAIMSMKIPESHEGKCMLFCAHKKFNVQNDDGSINAEGAMETFEIVKAADAIYHGKLISAFNHCSGTPVDPDPCLYSAALSSCVLQKAKEEGIHDLMFE